jgi:DMSO/TMAO reductase YedYZ molybdopterin-dependent catalytic subunit
VDTPSRRTLAARAPDPASAAIALVAGVAGVAGSYAAAGFTPAFVAGPVAGFLAREMPAVVVRYVITVLGDLGEQLNVLAALAVATAFFAAAAFLGTAVARRFDRPEVGPPVAGGLAAALAFGVTAAALPSAAAGLAVGAVLAVGELASPSDPAATDDGRRRVLGAVASAVGVAGVGYLLGSRGGLSPNTGAGEPLEVSERLETDIRQQLALAADRSVDVDGLEPLVSESFYEVDINATDPTVVADDWTLSVTGLVDREVTYTYDEIRAMDAENRFVTLRCVGEPLNGRKMDNALWTGVPVADLLEPARPAEECCVLLRAADGYYQQFPLSALRDGFLAFGMNGDAMPEGHGYPVRALIPGHWGEINVKWLTGIEVLDEPVEGYWEERGWHGTGPVETVAKLHLVDHLADGRVRVGGHAYAGTRGVQRVEVSTDGGDAWTDAALSDPLPGEDVWRQWTHEYDPPGRTHELVVRTTDGEGTLQPREESDAFPSGPTGWVSRTVTR